MTDSPIQDAITHLRAVIKDTQAEGKEPHIGVFRAMHALSYVAKAAENLPPASVRESVDSTPSAPASAVMRHSAGGETADAKADNRRLRIRVDNDERTIATLKAQYDQLAADFKSAQQSWRETEHQIITERDRAVTAEKEINGLLNETADLIIQAAARRATAAAPAEEQTEHGPLLEGRLKRIHGVAS